LARGIDVVLSPHMVRLPHDMAELTDLENADAQLSALAGLLRERAVIGERIASLIKRAPHAGHVGEFIAARVFDIELHPHAAHPGSDGVFRSGPLASRSVNVKFYSRWDGLLDVPAHHAPDYILVLAGPAAKAGDTGPTSRCLIASAFLFEYAALVAVGVKPVVAASVKKALWEEARIYPEAGAKALLVIGDRQQGLLQAFGVVE
jgi:hypothetical protein